MKFIDELPPLGNRKQQPEFMDEQRELMRHPGKWGEVHTAAYRSREFEQTAAKVRKWEAEDGIFEVATRTVWDRRPTDLNDQGENHVVIYARFLPDPPEGR